MTQNVVVIDYGSGNLRSVAKALERVALERGLRRNIVISDEAATISRADRIILPGVGAFGDCRAGLFAIPGMMEAIETFTIVNQRPFLGICVGMQLMARKGLEHGSHDGFGWVEGTVRAIQTNNPALKIPHMGWNTLRLTQQGRLHPLFKGIKDGDHAYFVHSFFMDLTQSNVRLASTKHGEDLTAAIGTANLAGVQFHPEKSQATGLHFLGNFLEWQP